ncbi:AAC(3) family N-acetyltransferase [Thalassococcus sp. S3]|nr:AAC(3) family N-acetyltransferase [Thalassococcus sp. S3]
MTQMPATRDSLHQDMTALGIAEGDGVFVHASLGAIGPVVGGARAVIEALQDCVGPGGLIGMPAFSQDARWPDLIDREACTEDQRRAIQNAVPAHDPRLSHCLGMGLIADTFRQWPGTVRSDHPNVSVCLNGAEAQRFVAPHSAAWATGADTPLGSLARRANMKVLLIGVDWTRCSPLHTAEFYAKPRRTKIRRFKTGAGQAPWHEVPDVADDLGRIFPATGEAFEATGLVTFGDIGQAGCRLCPYDQLLTFATRFIGSANAESGDRH